jgi:hypothetical protein
MHLKKNRFTVADIAEAICRADGIEVRDHALVTKTIRNIANRGVTDSKAKRTVMLRGGEETEDGRGTRTFPAMEVFRVSLILEMLSLAMDGRAVSAMDIASGKPTNPFERSPALIDRNGGSTGQFDDAIYGVAKGELWFFEIKLHRASAKHPMSFSARFFQEDFAQTEQDNKAIESFFGARPVRTRVTINLKELWTGLVEQVGVPE